MNGNVRRLFVGSAVLLALLVAATLSNRLASPEATDASRHETSGLNSTGPGENTGTDLFGEPSPPRGYPHPERDQFYEIPGVGQYARRLPDGLIEVLLPDGTTFTTHGPDPGP